MYEGIYYVYSCTLVLLASTKVRKYFHTTEGSTEVRKYGSTFVRKYFRKYESTFVRRYESTSVRKYLRRYSTCTVRVQYLSVQYLSTVFLREQHTVRRYFRKYNYNISYRATKIIKVHVVVAHTCTEINQDAEVRKYFRTKVQRTSVFYYL